MNNDFNMNEEEHWSDKHFDKMNGSLNRMESFVDQIGHQMRVTAIKVKKQLLSQPIELTKETFLMVRTVWSSEENLAMIGWKYTAPKKTDKDVMQEIRVIMMDGVKYLIVESVEYNANHPMDEDSIQVYQSWCEGLQEAQCHVAYIIGVEMPNQIEFE